MTETIALVRDLVIIVSGVVVAAVAVTAGILLLKLYRPLRQTAQNFEAVSTVILQGLIRPLNSLASLAELANRVLALIDDFRSRAQAPEDAEGE